MATDIMKAETSQNTGSYTLENSELVFETVDSKEIADKVVVLFWMDINVWTSYTLYHEGSP